MFVSGQSQSAKKETKPYKILTSGRQVTIKSSKNIQHVMLWSSSGHRVVEQRDVNTTSYNFLVPISEKIFFLMVSFDNRKVFTEKIGL
jgi:hypothetical protein